jgi:hypothetical protein
MSSESRLNNPTGMPQATRQPEPVGRLKAPLSRPVPDLRTRCHRGLLLSIALFAACIVRGADPEGVRVEAEEDVYTFAPANNGAGPMWCAGSTCLVRVGDDLFASGIETIPSEKPLNNVRWMLFKRGANGWETLQTDPTGRTREPCPLAAFPDGRLFLSANPTLKKPGEEGGGAAKPLVLAFKSTNPKAGFESLEPRWEGAPRFTEHSYRSLAADAANRELILFQNIDYTHAEWSFLDRTGAWSAQGRIKWPWGADYAKPQAIRTCYPNVALRDRAVHFFGVSDVHEPNEAWHALKKELTGQEWDYDFRRLFYTWTPDVTREPFHEWIEIASRDKTGGFLWPNDLWLAPDGAAHLLWTERALDERLREKFFPAERQSHSMRYAVVRNGKILLRRTLFETHEGEAKEIISAGRFQPTPEGRLFIAFHASGNGASENRVAEMLPGGELVRTTRIPLRQPFTSYFTATVRSGSAPSRTLEMLGTQSGKANTISYARVKLW